LVVALLSLVYEYLFLTALFLKGTEAGGHFDTASVGRCGGGGVSAWAEKATALGGLCGQERADTCGEKRFAARESLRRGRGRGVCSPKYRVELCG
jgi:hypothetical protein